MKQISGAAALALTLLLQACLSSSVVLHVAPDGSGRAVITSRVYEEALQDFQAIFSVAPADRKSAEDSMPTPDEDDLSSQFGTAVGLVSSDLEKTADGVIRRTIVTFPDITQLRIQFPPVLSVPAEGAFGMNGVSEPPVITFAMRPQENGDRLLLVRMPDTRTENEQNPPDAATRADPVLDENFRRAINGMSVEFSVELDVPLLRTNAPEHQGNSATILSIDVAKVIDNLSDDKLAQAMNPGSIQELLWRVGDLPGAVLPRDREIFLEFQPPSAPPPSPAQAAARLDTDVFLAPLTKIDGRL